MEELEAAYDASGRNGEASILQMFRNYTGHNLPRSHNRPNLEGLIRRFRDGLTKIATPEANFIADNIDALRERARKHGEEEKQRAKKKHGERRKTKRHSHTSEVPSPDVQTSQAPETMEEAANSLPHGKLPRNFDEKRW